MSQRDQTELREPPMPYDDLAWSLEFDSDESGVHLLGMRCQDCGTVMAGRRYACSTCISRNLASARFGPGGVLYSFTHVHVSPVRSEPYTIGYVDLDGGVRVLALADVDPASLACDLRVDLVLGESDWFVRPANVPESAGEEER